MYWKLYIPVRTVQMSINLKKFEHFLSIVTLTLTPSHTKLKHFEGPLDSWAFVEASKAFPGHKFTFSIKINKIRPTLKTELKTELENWIKISKLRNFVPCRHSPLLIQLHFTEKNKLEPSYQPKLHQSLCFFLLQGLCMSEKNQVKGKNNKWWKSES